MPSGLLREHFEELPPERTLAVAKVEEREPTSTRLLG
jgi:hypothetical protein